MNTKRCIAIIACFSISLAGCDTLATIQQKPGFVSAEIQAIKLTQAFFKNGGKMDAAWGIGQGLNLIGDVTTFAIQQKKAKNAEEAKALAAAKLKQTVKEFAGDQTAVNGLAEGIAKAVTSNSSTPEQLSRNTLIAAAAIQKVAAASMP